MSCRAPAGTYEDPDDCDDDDVSINPGASELCDGTDNDCDPADGSVNPGAVEDCTTAIDDTCDGDTNDEDALGCTTYHPDVDSDGYGDASDEACTCIASGDYSTTNGTDCDDDDDDDATAYPGATESWYDGVDGDCDGLSDNDRDADGHDGSGKGGDDCDDGDASLHPGAFDWLNDGADNNCDGDTDGPMVLSADFPANTDTDAAYGE